MGARSETRWVERNCDWCGNLYETRTAYLDRGEGKFCSRSCGSLHSRSLRSPAESKSRLNMHAREAYIEMFGEPVCMMCGAEPADVHHRDKDRENNDPTNLQALCRSCHTILHNSMEPKRKKVSNA